MRCLHILRMDKLSGAEKMALLICKNIQKYKPIVVCGGDILKDIFTSNGIESYSLSFSNKDLIHTLKELKNIVKENNIKIVHAHDNDASMKAYLLKSIYKLDIKIISHIHNCYPFLKSNGLKRRIDSFLRPRYDFNIACGKLVYDFYKENTNYLKEDKVEILSNAMDIDEIVNSNLNNVEEIKKSFNIPSDKIILGFIGRLDEQKGIIPFINEFAKNKDKFIDCKILLIGSGSQEKEVNELIKNLELEEFFILTGFQKDTYKFYPVIDIFFLPSLYEGLPMVILEAMTFKKAIVTMDVGSINEVIINEKTGILVNKEDYKSFIDSLAKIKNSKESISYLQENAFNHIEKNYNIKKYTSKLIDIYDNIIV